MFIAVTGATGQLGRLVIRMLQDKVSAVDLIALARSTARASDLGVTVREADYTRPETLDTALADIDALLLISSNEVGQRATQHRNVIEAANKAGVKWLVYTSLLHADTSPLILAGEHRETEAALRSSGIPYTILRNGWYTENYTTLIPAALGRGQLIGSADGGRISGATRRDYADAAVAVLTGGSHIGRTYELAADEAWTLADMAAEISNQTGRPILYKDLPEAEYAAALVRLGMPEPVAKAYASFDAAAAKGALFDDSHQLSTLIGRPTTPLAEAVAEALRRDW